MKHGVCPALFLAVVIFLFVPTPTFSQKASAPPQASNDTSLPDAPSATQATTCTKNNGDPCPDWLHRLIGQYPALPESTEPQLQRDPSTVHFWTYRGWDEPPLRNNKQVFRSKLFVGAHVGGAIAMIMACRNKNSRENWASEIPAVSALFGMDYLQFRFIGGPNALAAPVYEMIKYGRASTR